LPHLKSIIHHLKSVCYLFLLPCALSLAPCAADAIAASVTLGWDSNTEPDLEGYVIYRNAGSPGPPYDYSDTLPEDELADPLHPKATLTGLQEGKEYYIALTAYNTNGDESSFSNDVCVEVVNGAVEACSESYTSAASSASSSSGSDGGSSGSGGGGGSASCFISAAAGELSIFSKFIAGPDSRSRFLALSLLLLVSAAAVKLKSQKAYSS
jgi:hypothetical protein